MLIYLAWQHLWTEKHLALVMLLVLSLVAGFAAAQPAYRDRLTDAAAGIVAGDLDPEMATITLSQSRSIDPGAMDVIESVLGPIVTDPQRYSRAPGKTELPYLGKICGYTYQPGEALTVNTPLALSTADHCYIPYGFEEPETLFTLVEGRWPEVLPDRPPESPRLMGEPQVEAVLAVDTAELTRIEVGDRIVIGEQADQAVIVEIVGTVESRIPANDIFWHGDLVALQGEWTPIGDDMRLEIGPIVPQATFDRWITPLTETPYYAWWMAVDPAKLTADDLDTLKGDLYQIESRIRLTQPDIELLTGLRAATEQYHDQVAQFEDVLIVVGATLWGMLVAMGGTAVLLIQDQRRAAWQILISRGANRRQIVGAMLLALAGLSIVAVLIGLGWAWVLLALVGPSTLPGTNALTLVSVLFGLGGAGTALAALALPAWITARRSHQPLRPPMSYPPHKPIWSRFYLDVIVLAAGVLLLFRLLYLASDGVSRGLRDLAGDPGRLAHHLATGQDGAVAGGLGDPFNLAGPALILMGIALLWLRVHPWLARIPAWIAIRIADVTRPGSAAELVAWREVTRAPGQYTALALMISAPLVLGAGSLALEATHNSAAWQIARQETGADVRLAFDLRQAPVDQIWDTLPGVTDATELINLDAIQPPMTLIGIEPGALPAIAAVPAFSAPVETLPGIALPDSTVAIQVAVYSVPNSDDPGALTLSAVLLDRRGVPVTLPMEATSDAEGKFVTHRATLPDNPARIPWRLVGFRFASERRERHTLYLDNVIVSNAQGQASIIEGFEAEVMAGWTGSPDQPDNAIVLSRSTGQAAEGAASLHIEYEAKYSRYANLQPLLLATPPDTFLLPVIVSEAFIEDQSQRTVNEPRLGMGDTSGVRLELPWGGFWLPYRIEGITTAFPTLPHDAKFIVAPRDALRLMLNATVLGDTYYDANQIWLELDGRAPGANLRDAIADVPDATETTYAWNRYGEIKRDPALLAVAGLLRFSFVTAAGLSVLYVTAYGLVIVPRRRESLAVLSTLGELRIGRVVVIEIGAVALPLLLVSSAAGVLLVFLLLPFIALLSDTAVQVPAAAMIGLWTGVATVGIALVNLGIRQRSRPVTHHHP